MGMTVVFPYSCEGEVTDRPTWCRRLQIWSACQDAGEGWRGAIGFIKQELYGSGMLRTNVDGF
jgi:hypothetical protein